MSTDLLVVVVLPTVLLSFITVANTATTIATTATTVALLLTPIAASTKASGAFLQGATLERTTCEAPRTLFLLWRASADCCGAYSARLRARQGRMMQQRRAVV